MQRRIGISTFLLLAAWLAAPPSLAASKQWVDASTARSAARAKVSKLGRAATHVVAETAVVVRGAEPEPIAYLFDLEPPGFVIVAGHRSLPPIIAYSFTDRVASSEPERGRFHALLAADLELRLAQASHLPGEVASRRDQAWARLLAAPGKRAKTPAAPQQWPPEGTTATGGWLEESWHQNQPYNADCPLDPVTTSRSVAGCPAVAMAMILDYHHTTDWVQLSDVDDYYHSYAGRDYWIDDDWQALDFPSFNDLSAALDVLNGHYRGGIPADDADRAALTFACGASARQVYTSSVSGTFGVGQAFDAYQRFLVDGCELLAADDPDLWPRLSKNMMEARPAHLAVVNADWTAGHNVVVDGYNTDNYYHLNFGWGGPANGWYLLPDEIPYDLTVIEGVIIDIEPSVLFADGFESGNASRWSSF